MDEAVIRDIADLMSGELPEEHMDAVILTGLSLKYVAQHVAADIPNTAQLSVIVAQRDAIQTRLTAAFTAIERAIPFLGGVYDALGVPWHTLSDDTVHAVLGRFQQLAIDTDDWPAVVQATRQWCLRTQGRSGSEHLTPHFLNKLMVTLLDLDGGTFYDGTAGTAGTLCAAGSQAKRTGKPLQLYGQEIRTETWARGKLYVLLSGYTDATYAHGDTLRAPQFVRGTRVQTFDYVAMNSPFGLKLNDRLYTALAEDPYGRFTNYRLSRGNADLAFVLHALASLNGNGRGIVIVTNGVLMRGGSDRDMRRQLLQEDRIEAVIELPERLLPQTSIATNVLVLNKNKAPSKRGHVQFIQARDLYAEKGRTRYLTDAHIAKIHAALATGAEEKGFSTTVPLAAIGDNLLCATYIVDNEVALEGYGVVRVDVKQLAQSRYPVQPLQQLATLYRGLNITMRSMEEVTTGPYKLIKLSDVQEGAVDIAALTAIALKINVRSNKYEVQAGDVIVSSRGVAIKTAVIPAHKDTVLLSQNFIGIRPNADVDPNFLKAYLDSPVAQYDIGHMMRGTVAPTLNPKQLATLPVVVPPLDVQRDIAAKYRAAREQYAAALQQAEDELQQATQQLHEAMGIRQAYDILTSD